MAQELYFYTKGNYIKMNAEDKKINSIIMNELGFEPTENGFIRDQDTGNDIKINGVTLVAPGLGANRKNKEMEFDPYNNKKMMGQLFGYFLDKVSDESDEEIVSFYDINTNTDKSKIECKKSDNSTITSGEYKKDSLKYVDIIMRLNGETNPEDYLREYDKVNQPTVISKKSASKGAKKNERSSNSKTASNR